MQTRTAVARDSTARARGEKGNPHLYASRWYNKFLKSAEHEEVRRVLDSTSNPFSLRLPTGSDAKLLKQSE